MQLIDINKIAPHPHNPRKDLGDLTELSLRNGTHELYVRNDTDDE